MTIGEFLRSPTVEEDGRIDSSSNTRGKGIIAYKPLVIYSKLGSGL